MWACLSRFISSKPGFGPTQRVCFGYEISIPNRLSLPYSRVELTSRNGDQTNGAMDRQALLRLLESASSLSKFVESTLLSGVPWIFRGDPSGFASWRQACADAGNVLPENVFIVGSAATGFSLSPIKAGRPFRPVSRAGPPSDIDLAIVDEGLFMSSWNYLVKLDRGYSLAKTLGLSLYHAAAQDDPLTRVRINVYWGRVSHAHALAGTDFSRRLRSLFVATTRRAPFLGHQAIARVYRRYDDLLGYHVSSIRSLRRSLQQSGGHP